MTSRAISWIGLIPFTLWLIPLQAKKASPELFGGPLFQWTTAAVNAVLIPLLVLLALKLLASPDRKKVGLGLLFSAGFPLLALLLTYGVFSPLLARSQLMLTNDQVMRDRLPALIEAAREHKDPAKRRQAARALHLLCGILAVYRNESGELEVYRPGAEDRKRWEDSFESRKTVDLAVDVIDSQLRQMPWLFAMNLGAFVLITGAGLTWHAYRKPREVSSSATG